MDDDDFDDYVDEDFDDFDFDDPRQVGYIERQNYGGGLAVVEGLSERIQRTTQGVEEITKKAIHAIISEDMENNGVDKEMVVSTILRVPAYYRLKLDAAVIAALAGKDITTKTQLIDFIKSLYKGSKIGVDPSKASDIDITAVYRYMRLFKNS